MNEDTSNVLEFVAPLSLERCVRRLEARHENMQWFSWRWQHRTWISLRPQDPSTYRFTMKRIERSSFIPMGSLAVVRGYLRRLDGEHTVVLAEKHVAYLWVMMPLIALVGIVAAMLLPKDPSTTPADMRIMAVAIVVIGLGWLVTVFWQIGAQTRELIGTLKEALESDRLSG
jgi:hypothetical protein